jgi:phospholipase/carboxylesterase
VNDEANLVIEPPETATASVIWLHGLGADGHDFEPIVAELGDAVTRHVRYVFPHAPRIPVTINGGAVMRAWYDISEMDLAKRADESGVRSSAGILEKLIEAEIASGIPSPRILLAGFSQGGAIALHTGLRYDKPLAGIMALSTYLPLQETVADERQQANSNIPIFLAHGSQDPVIPLALSEQSRALLASLGYQVQCHTYPMPHSVCPGEIRDIAVWLQDVLANPPA